MDTSNESINVTATSSRDNIIMAVFFSIATVAVLTWLALRFVKRTVCISPMNLCYYLHNMNILRLRSNIY